jgi:hypothetical protein
MAAALAARPVGRALVLEIGAFERPVIGSWPRYRRADVDAVAAPDGPPSFYYRPMPPEAAIRLPVTAFGPVAVRLRALSRIRSGVTVFLGRERLGEAVIGPWQFTTFPGPWLRFELTGDAPGHGAPLEIGLAARPLPLVRRAADDLATAEVLLDSIEVEAANGLRLTPSACLTVGLVPIAVAIGLALLRLRPWMILSSAGAAALLAVVLVRAGPIPALLAIPRLGLFAVAAAAIASVILRPLVTARERSAWTALVAAGVLFHGSVVFFPDHQPPDLDVHVRRTIDFAGVPWEYGALLRYGSHMPTASQDINTATDAFGEQALVPYSPLPYFAYYVLHAAGLDLAWAITALNAAVAMVVAALLWVAAARIWDRPTAWLAAVLFALDLPVWHHLGRGHAPAVFGGALGTAALLHLAAQADDVVRARAVAISAGILAMGALGYASLAVLLGLFGCALIVLLLAGVGGWSWPARRGIVLALAAGGALAGALYYFHYVPGLLRGGGAMEQAPDLSPGRTFFVFHNESRQSLRIWVLGFWMPMLAAAAAAPFALRRARRPTRPVLIAWLLAWALFMVLKEPAFFPRILRYGKELQFVSPLAALFIAAAVMAIPRARMRWAVAAIVVATAAWLQARDFAHHAVSLRL